MAKPLKVTPQESSDIVELRPMASAREILEKTFQALQCCAEDDKTYLKQLHGILTVALGSEVVDPTERRLLAQAEELFNLGMDCLARSRSASLLCHTESFTSQATKLLRLHNETVEALARYRRRGEQKVVVQHVTVNGNGPAVVGASIS